MYVGGEGSKMLNMGIARYSDVKYTISVKNNVSIFIWGTGSIVNLDHERIKSIIFSLQVQPYIHIDVCKT